MMIRLLKSALPVSRVRCPLLSPAMHTRRFSALLSDVVLNKLKESYEYVILVDSYTKTTHSVDPGVGKIDRHASR